MNNKKLKHKYFLTKNNFEQLSDLNAEFFESAKLSLLDPLGLYLANDVKWIKLNQNWNSLKFPVVMGGKGQPILLLHGFDSSFLEFRRIYKSLKRNFQVIIPDLLGFGFSPRTQAWNLKEGEKEKPDYMPNLIRLDADTLLSKMILASELYKMENVEERLQFHEPPQVPFHDNFFEHRLIRFLDMRIPLLLTYLGYIPGKEGEYYETRVAVDMAERYMHDDFRSVCKRVGLAKEVVSE